MGRSPIGSVVRNLTKLRDECLNVEVFFTLATLGGICISDGATTTIAVDSRLLQIGPRLNSLFSEAEERRPLTAFDSTFFRCRDGGGKWSDDATGVSSCNGIWGDITRNHTSSAYHGILSYMYAFQNNGSGPKEDIMTYDYIFLADIDV